MKNIQRNFIHYFKFLIGNKFNYIVWITKLAFLCVLTFFIVKLAKSLDWVNVDWYLRMQYPTLYRQLSANIFHIFSVAITLCLFLYTYLGFQFSFKMTTLVFHVILLLGVKSLLQVWYQFLCVTYVLLGFADLVKFFMNRKSRKLIENSKLVVCCFVIFYYHVWNYYNNEPLTNFVNTPDFIPSALCENYVNSSNNFENIYKEFIQMHNRVLDLSTPVNEKKAVIFRVFDGGLGNRIQGLLSSFLLAVVLNRAFFVDWRRNDKEAYASLHDLFDDPDFDWDAHSYLTSEQHTNVLRDEYYDLLSTWVPYCRLCPFRGYPQEDEVYNKMLCKPDLGFDPNQRIIAIKSTQWFAPVLAHNPHFRQKICSITGPDIFGTLFRKLIKPNKFLDKRMEFFRNEFKKSDHVIGLQIRKIEGNSVDDNQVEVFLRCAKLLAIQAKQPKYYISTDNVETKNHVVKLLGEDHVIINNNSLDRGSVDGMQNALIDMWLLGETNDMIISPYSTFGYAAHGRTSKVPYLVTRNNKCVKMLTSQPCFQYWFGVTLAPCFKKETMLTIDMINQEDCWT